MQKKPCKSAFTHKDDISQADLNKGGKKLPEPKKPQKFKRQRPASAYSFKG